MKIEQVNIPYIFVEDQDLSCIEKMILAIIYHFNNPDLINKGYVCGLLSLSGPTYIKSIKNLNKMGYITLDDRLNVGHLKDVYNLFKGNEEVK